MYMKCLLGVPLETLTTPKGQPFDIAIFLNRCQRVQHVFFVVSLDIKVLRA